MKTIALFGAGAVGGTIAGWVRPHHDALYVVDLPANVQALNARGVTTYVSDQPEQKLHTPLKAYASLKELPQKPDYLLICVKNYSLDAVCKMAREQLGDHDVTAVGFQNGVENQQILPKYFKKCLYGIVAYNAWQDKPGDPTLVGAQKRGPLVLGSVGSPAPTPELVELTAILSRGVKTVSTDRLADAAHSKMIINLTNSLTTLVGHGFRPISDAGVFQRLLTQLTAEGVSIVRASGYQECRMDGMPSWMIMRAAAALPRFITRPIFNKNLRKMVVSSMAQDVLQRGGTDTELESLNGYFVRLADKQGLKAPYNRAIYELCRERFSRPGFEPMDVREVWDRVRTQL